jgi:hypothetical protein
MSDMAMGPDSAAASRFRPGPRFPDMREFELIGADGRPHGSRTPGAPGGHRRNKIYRPCAGCLPQRYSEWKADPEAFAERHRSKPPKPVRSRS